jgi:hypothetical protein
MGKSFGALVKRTTNKRTRDRAVARTKELLRELPVAELRRLASKRGSRGGQPSGTPSRTDWSRFAGESGYSAYLVVRRSQ